MIVLFSVKCLLEVWKFRTLLKTYEVALGQRVNYAKSALFFSPNVPLDFRTTLSDIMAVSVVEDLGKYLGVPSSFTRNRRDDFKAIKQRVWQTL